jgi:hypothetical protein
MSDMGFGNVDMAELDKMLAPLYAQYGGTPSPEELQQQSDALYDFRNSFLISSAGGGDDGSGGVTPPGPTEPAYKQDARMTLKAILAKYKLESLYDKIWSNYTSDMIDITDSDAIFLSIREEDKYKERFAGNEIRRSKGLGDLSPATYVALEDSYRQTLRSNGIPADLFDTPAELAELIANDVSVSEFNSRIETARSLMQDAPASVRDQMSRLFNVTEGQLLAYYIDPDKALPVLKEQERAARIGSAAVENAGMQLSTSVAEDLSRRGFTEDEARVGFSKVSKLGELAQTFAGEQNITEQQIIASQFGFDTQAEKDLARRKEQRVGEFKRGGSYTRTSGVTSGSIETGIGKAK